MCKFLCNEGCIHELVCTRLSATGGVYNCEHYMNTVAGLFTVKSLVDFLFSHNEYVALHEIEDDHHYRTVWEGMAWEIPIEYEKTFVEKFFGAIPETISKADTINILLKSPKKNMGECNE